MNTEAIAEIKLACEEALAKVKCEYYQLAAGIMRELGHPYDANQIDQYRYVLANKVHTARKAASPGLAASVAKGVKHDAELIRKAEHKAREDECSILLDRVAHGTMSWDIAIGIILERSYELEQAGGETDDE